jgi:putative ABC transport system substrate-binding protein
MARNLFLMLMLQFCLLQYAIAQNRDVLLLYPETESPYHNAYEQIIIGIKSSISYELQTLSLPKDYKLASIQEWIDENKNSANYLIALGSRALKVSNLLRYHQLQVVASAVDVLPGRDQVPGVSIRVHPAVYLQHLRLLSPNSTRLLLFHNKNDEALVPFVEHEAQKIGIVVRSVPVNNATEGMRNIASIINDVDPKKTAIWFTRNVIELNSELFYPYILEESWNRYIPVFSGMISHTKRGFLFSLYPDYQGVGQEIGQIIRDHEQSHTVVTTHFSKAVKFALNIRTLQHLGLMPDNTTLQKVDLMFPAWKTAD